MNFTRSGGMSRHAHDAGQKMSSDRIRFPVRRSSNPMGNVNSTRNYNSLNAAYGSGDANPAPVLDFNEFPAYMNRSAGDNVPYHVSRGKPYMGIVMRPPKETPEFTMSSEDFPALPTPRNRETEHGSGSGDGGNTTGSENKKNDFDEKTAWGQRIQTASGIQTSLDGRVTNIPASMIPNQFGMVGLLNFVRASDKEPHLAPLAFGHDLTNVGVNVNASSDLYPTFSGPWGYPPYGPQDIDFHVPPEYVINHIVKDRLPPPQFERFNEDLLFYMFYNNPGDALQIRAAHEIYNRGWRYHVGERMWMTLAPGVALIEKTSTYERGIYHFFDPRKWRKFIQEFHLDYHKLEGQPVLY